MSTTGATISTHDGDDQDATRRIELPDERPSTGQAHGSPPPSGQSPGYGDERTDRVGEPEPEPEPRRGRDLGFAAIGALVGLLLTFVVIALTTGGANDDPAADDTAIEARDAEIAERDRQIDELDARILDLEAQLAEVGDDSADQDAELAAQRQALDERLEALDARVEEADNRQAALDERTAALDQREAELAEREAEGDAPPPDGGGDGGDDGAGGGGVDLDDLEETAQGIVDRVLDEIRNLFGQN